MLDLGVELRTSCEVIFWESIDMDTSMRRSKDGA